jgi:acylphosphatase
MGSGMKSKSLKIKVHGRVQGVGFRYSTVQAAIKSGVQGWVRNEWDGSVLIYCEGDSSDVDRFISWCRKGPSLSHVVSLDISDVPYEGLYTGFKIDY